MEFDQAHGEIVMVSELMEKQQEYGNSTIRVVGNVQEFDPASERLTLAFGGKHITISTRLLAPLACRRGEIWHFIGEVEVEPTFHVLARIGASMAGLDLRLFHEALKVRRQCLQDLDDIMGAVAAFADASQMD